MRAIWRDFQNWQSVPGENFIIFPAQLLKRFR
jgi:hypothetical protein